MRHFNLAFVVVALALLFVSTGEARRIAERTLARGDVDQIYLAPGIVTSLELPENVKEVLTGAPQIVKTMISSSEPNEVILSLASSRAFSTNLIVRTVKDTYVFDLLPSLEKHHDLIIVKAGVGERRDEAEMSLHEQRLKYERELKTEFNRKAHTNENI